MQYVCRCMCRYLCLYMSIYAAKTLVKGLSSPYAVVSSARPQIVKMFVRMHADRSFCLYVPARRFVFVCLYVSMHTNASFLIVLRTWLQCIVLARYVCRSALGWSARWCEHLSWSISSCTQCMCAYACGYPWMCVCMWLRMLVWLSWVSHQL
jgi:hypothetical protein